MEQAPPQTAAAVRPARSRRRQRVTQAPFMKWKWLRLCVDVSLVPPAAGKLWCLDTTGRRLRLIVFAPVPVVILIVGWLIRDPEKAARILDGVLRLLQVQ